MNSVHLVFDNRVEGKRQRSDFGGLFVVFEENEE